MPDDSNTKDIEKQRPQLSRRQFLRGAGAVGVTSLVAAPIVFHAVHKEEHVEAATLPDSSQAPVQSGSIRIALQVNGRQHYVTVEPRTTLLNALRNHLDPPLTGAKLVCDSGNCGACTVDMDGKTVYACMILAADAAGKKITTIEGVSPDSGKLHPIQAAFIEHDALQCGFCTPGFVMSVRACLNKTNHPNKTDVQWACAGNICRCGAYPRIFDAAVDAASRMHGKEV